MSDKVSIVIPSRNEIFLTNTIKDLLSKAKGDIEIIVNLDGYWPEKDEVVNDPRVIYLHKGEPKGMRAGINSAVAIAKGKYIMKIDGHCMVGEGFDEILKANCEPNWVVIPRRKRLDAENWKIEESSKPDVDYECVSFPNNPSDFGGPGLNGQIWTERILERKGKPEYDIDENLSFQGSCWFMHRDYFYKLELMDDVNYGSFWNEAQEIGLKAWLSGGKVMTNKKTWYAHLHKGRKFGRGYKITNRTIEQGAMFTNKWPHNQAWDKQTIPFEWLIEHFWPIPGWPNDWKEQICKNSDTVKQDTLGYIVNKYNIDTSQKSPIEIPNVGRDTLAKWYKELGFKRGAEIGVEAGLYSEVLCRESPDLELYCIDSWLQYEGYRTYVPQSKVDGFFEDAKRRLAPYNAHFIKAYSADAVKQFEDESLDFVFIDGNHTYPYVLEDIKIWLPKIKKGGIISGHDYIKRAEPSTHDVIGAVNDYTKENNVHPWFLLGRKEKVPGEMRDQSRSWFWVKP